MPKFTVRTKKTVIQDIQIHASSAKMAWEEVCHNGKGYCSKSKTIEGEPEVKGPNDSDFISVFDILAQNSAYNSEKMRLK